MKWVMIAFVACGGVDQGIVLAEPISVSLEWVELDCKKCPELAVRLQPKEGSVGFVERSDPKFADLEKAVKRVLVHHVEWMEPGTKAKHSTRIDETTFDLGLAIRVAENGAYDAEVNVSRKQGAELPASVRPGTQLTPAQMKGVQKAAMSYRLRLLPGRRMAIGALANAGDAARNNSGPKMLVLIIGLDEPEEASHGSGHHSAESR